MAAAHRLAEAGMVDGAVGTITPFTHEAVADEAATRRRQSRELMPAHVRRACVHRIEDRLADAFDVAEDVEGAATRREEPLLATAAARDRRVAHQPHQHELGAVAARRAVVAAGEDAGRGRGAAAVAVRHGLLQQRLEVAARRQPGKVAAGAPARRVHARRRVDGTPRQRPEEEQVGTHKGANCSNCSSGGCRASCRAMAPRHHCCDSQPRIQCISITDLPTSDVYARHIVWLAGRTSRAPIE